MNGQMIESLQRAYAQALAEAKRYNQAAEGIAAVIRAAEGVPIVHAGTPDPLGIGIEPPVAPAKVAGKTAKAAKAAKAAKEKQSFKAAKAERQEKAAKMARVCPHCGDQYLAKRKDQTNCLADACKVAAKDAWKAKRAAPAATPETGIEPAGNPSRLERIKALVGGGEVANG